MPGDYDATVSVHYGDGEHTFGLRIGEVRKLEKARGTPEHGPVGIEFLYFRLAGWLPNDRAHADDAYEAIRFGYIRGEGKSPTEAAKFLEAWFDLTPFIESKALALAIIGAYLNGPDELQKKTPPGGSESQAAVKTDSTMSPDSTATAQS